MLGALALLFHRVAAAAAIVLGVTMRLEGSSSPRPGQDEEQGRGSSLLLPFLCALIYFRRAGIEANPALLRVPTARLLELKLRSLPDTSELRTADTIAPPRTDLNRRCRFRSGFGSERATERRFMRIRDRVVLLFVIDSSWPREPHARSGRAERLFLSLEPSARLGHGASLLRRVFWGGDANDLANPALLGGQQGVQLNHGRTQLVPDLAADVYLRTDRLTLGLWGAGVLSVADRSRIGSHEAGLRTLDRDRRVRSSSLVCFESHENPHSLGVGVNLLELAENLSYRRLHSPHPVSRFGDISLGYTTKKAEVHLAALPGDPEEGHRDRRRNLG